MGNSNKSLDVLAVGALTIDLVIKVKELPGYDGKVIGQHVDWLPGGTVPNFACAASRLGLRTGFLGTVGDDEPGRLAVKDLDRFGVSQDRLVTLAQTDTMYTVILLPPGGERAIIVVPTYSDDIPFSDQDRACITSARAVYTMPANMSRFEALARIVHAGGGLVMIDVEPTLALDEARLKRILAVTDLASFNLAGLESVAGKQHIDLITKARRMLALGPSVVIVTLGSDGCLIVTTEEKVRCPGFDVRVVDTTGAGDCFNAAFLSGYLNDWPLERTAKFANAAAALSVTGLGPRGGIPTREEVLELLA